MDIFTVNFGASADTKEKFIKRREEIKSYLSESVFGRIPEPPEHLRADIKAEDKCFGGGIAVLREFELVLTVDGREISLPFKSIAPSGEGKYPTFIYIDYDSHVPGKYLPAEEIAERGYAVFCFSYKDVCADGAGFKSGIAKYIAPNGRKKDSPGKIALWAWAISRVADYALNQAYVDVDNVAVIGHGLLARAALVAGGYDERIKYVILNNLEFGEDYISRPYLFCKNFWENAVSDFDSLALSLCVPRHIVIGAAADDCVSDNEKGLCALAALGSAYKLFGKTGLAYNGEVLGAPITLAGDSLLYRLREGVPYLCRRDWNAYMDYIDSVKSC